jgi:ABC-type Mn2+/Zn2+ transport system permease subunit
MVWLAPLVAVACGFVGLEISYQAGVAAGPAIALTGLAAFAIALGSRQAALAARRVRHATRPREG